MKLTVVGMALCGAALGTALAPQASAEPAPLPPQPYYVPGYIGLIPGSYAYQPYVQYVTPPAANDTRGVRTGTNADPALSGTGLPGHKLGASPGRPNVMTLASARYGISAGMTPPQPPAWGGVNVGAGSQTAPLEDPTGQPVGVVGPESTMATDYAGYPVGPGPVLEDPYGQPPQQVSPTG